MTSTNLFLFLEKHQLNQIELLDLEYISSLVENYYDSFYEDLAPIDYKDIQKLSKEYQNTKLATTIH